MSSARLSFLVALEALVVGLHLCFIVLDLFIFDGLSGDKGGVGARLLRASLYSGTQASFVSVLAQLALLRWIHGAVADLRAITPAGTVPFSPGGSIWRFFVPVLNLFHGFRVMSVLADASDPEQFPLVDEQEAEQEGGYRDSPVQKRLVPQPPRVLLGAWSVAWIGGILLGMAVGFLAGYSPGSFTAETLALSAPLFDLLRASSGVLTLLVVLAIDARTRESHRRALSFARGHFVDPAPDARPIAAGLLAAVLSAGLGGGLLIFGMSGVASLWLWLVSPLMLLVFWLLLRPYEAPLRRRWGRVFAVVGLSAAEAGGQKARGKRRAGKK